MKISRSQLIKPVEIELSDFQQRILAVCLAAVPLLLLTWIAGSALSDMIEYHARLAVLKREDAIYEDLIQGYPARKAAIEEVRRSGIQDAFFLGGDRSATRLLDQRVGRVLATSHVVADVHQVGVVDGSSQVSTLREHLEFSCDIGKLTQILSAVAASRPLLFVDHLSITDVAGEARPRGPHILKVDMLVSAYKRSSS